MKITIDVKVVAEKPDEVSFHLVKEVYPIAGFNERIQKTHETIHDQTVLDTITGWVKQSVMDSRTRINHIRELSEKTGLDIGKLFEFYQVDTIEELLAEQASHISQLVKRVPRDEVANAPTAPRAG